VLFYSMLHLGDSLMGSTQSKPTRKASSFRPRVEELESRVVPATAFALSGSNLLAFDTANPTTTTSTTITGVDSNETLVGIDIRPQNGFLYGLGVNAAADTATLYSISTNTGLATAVGAIGGITGAGNLEDPATVGYGVDFNPMVDRFRVVSGSLNFRVNPNTGTLVQADSAINTGTTTVDATAYTNNAPGASVTTQYTLDAVSKALYIQNTPNSGTQMLVATVSQTLGGPALDFTAVNGFDIPSGINATNSSGTGVSGAAFAILTVSGSTQLYSINLVNGVATQIGNVGSGTTPVQGLAIHNDLTGTPAIGLSADGTQIVRFNTSVPGTGTAITLGAITTGEQLVAIDFRPATGQLFGLGIDHTLNQGTLYRIDPQGGQVTAIGTPGSIVYFQNDGMTRIDLPDPASAGYGLDFNPTVDRIRVTTSTGLNFRIRPDTGAAVDGDTSMMAMGVNPDANINGLPTGGVGVSATAYTNSFGQPITNPAGPTSQYTLDAATNTLSIQFMPNSGTQILQVPVTFNGGTLDFEEVNGFDIPGGVSVMTSGTRATGLGFAVLTVGGVQNLYSIDLTTGAASLIGATSQSLNGLTLAEAPTGTISFGAAAVAITESAGTVTLTLNRTSGSSGPVTVNINVTGGTATAGSDFTAGPYTVTFADGQTTQTLSIPLTADQIVEGVETITLTIASVSNGAVIGAIPTTTISVSDFNVQDAVGFALSNGTLIPISSVNTTAGTPITITGVTTGETLVAIDFRPQNGLLYGLGINSTNNTGSLYLIATQTGTATVVGTAGAITFQDGGGTTVTFPDPATVNYDIDFNPAVDRLRVVAGSLNFRIDPNTGNPIDGNLNMTPAPANTNTDGAISGATTTVGGTAYSNSFANNGGVTTQYTLDAASNSLYIQNPPNAGAQVLRAMVTLNGATLDFDDVKGFDILAGPISGTSNGVASGTGLAVLTVAGVDNLYRINLSTGVATLVGAITTTSGVDSVAFQSELGGTPSIALANGGTQLRRFLSTNPSAVTNVNITSVSPGETLVAIDFRPATGQLFGLGIDHTLNQGTLYRIDPQGGQVTAIGTPGSIVYFQNDGMTRIDLPDPASAGYGLDFNPTVDRIRVTTSTGLNFRINPNNGAAVDGDTSMAGMGVNPDANINGLPTGGVGVSATAYTNSFGQPLTTPARPTSQYTLDAVTDTLSIQFMPNSGTQTLTVPVTLNSAPLNFDAVSGFDIPANVVVTTSGQRVASGSGIAVLQVSGVSNVYSIDLVTGAATFLGTVGGTGTISGLALASTPVGVLSFSSATFNGNEGDGVANVTLTRTLGSSGPLTVQIMATGGTASAGTDFTLPITATFADGATTTTVAIPLINDSVNEVDETVILSLGTPSAGVLGSLTTATLTIADDDGPLAITASGTGADGSIIVRNDDGSTRFVITPYAGFIGGVDVAQGDITGDGVDDIITGAGAGGNPHVKVFDGLTGAEIRSFFAFGLGFQGGVSVSALDFDNNGVVDIIVAAGPGAGPHVKAFDGLTNAEVASFFAYDVGFVGGVSVANGDIDGDGIDDLITGALNGPAHVKVFKGGTGAEIRSFFAFDQSLLVGANVAATLDGRIIVGSASGTLTSVRVFNNDGSTATTFNPYPGFVGGIRVAVNEAGQILTGAGPGGGPHVKVFDPISFAELDSFFAFDQAFRGGVFVG
jgi:hypothetical protein